MSEPIMVMKIGRNSYDITSTDEFMDNGCCIQLLSQSKEVGSWNRKPNPVLPKRVIKELEAFERVSLEHNYGKGVQIFTLKES